jgi:hypothetical protein
MKSLEHIIREIREGKTTEKGSKTSLEHSIRKVVKGEKESSFADRTTKPLDEDVGGLIGSGTGGEPKLHAEDGKKKKTDEAIGILGTDDYKGNQFKSVRTQTPHIKPPGEADGHSQAPENVSRQRTLAKEKSSMTMHNKVTEEEQIDEYAVKPEIVAPEVTKQVIKKAAPSLARKGAAALVGGPIGAAMTAAELLGTAATGTELGRSVGKKIGQFIYGKPETKSFDKTKETKPGTAPETRPKQPEVKPLAPGAPIELPKTAPKPEEKPKAEPKPEEKPKVVPAASTAPAETTPSVDTKTKTATTPKSAPAETTPKSTADTTTTTPKGKKDYGIPGFSPAADAQTSYDVLHRLGAKVQAHYAKKHRMHAESVEPRKEIENVPRKGDRKSIEYVGRQGSEPKTTKEKTSRLAAIKNIIDEARKEKTMKPKAEAESGMGKEKKFVYPNETEVVIGPNPKNNFLDVEGSKLPKDYDNK